MRSTNARSRVPSSPTCSGSAVRHSAAGQYVAPSRGSWATGPCDSVDGWHASATERARALTTGNTVDTEISTYGFSTCHDGHKRQPNCASSVFPAFPVVQDFQATDE